MNFLVYQPKLMWMNGGAIETYTKNLLNRNGMLKRFPDRFRMIIDMFKSYLPLLNSKSYDYQSVCDHKEKIELLLAEIGVSVELFKYVGDQKSPLLGNTLGRSQSMINGMFVAELKQKMMYLLVTANQIISLL